VALASHRVVRASERERHGCRAEEGGVPAPDVLLVALASHHLLADVAAGDRTAVPTNILPGHLPGPLTLVGSLAAHGSEGERR
ncbi:hypothetical protein QBC41DRAFT_194064, partial [Cercophora samala]